MVFGIYFVPPSVFAAAGGKVEALKMPAWYERNGQKLALKPGIKLESGDVIYTGTQSRVLVRLEEGSVVKLGENAMLNINNIEPAKMTQNVFEALLRVSRGAFRFTTTELGKLRKRKVNVSIGTVTIGIRGTDIWGRSKPGEDLFALLEGKVAVKRNGLQFEMNEPLKYILAREGQPISAVTDIDQTQLGAWANETELQPGTGQLSVNGQWAVNMMSLKSAASAEDLQQKMNEAGYAAEIQPVQINESEWLRVRIEGFDTREDATQFASHINNRYGIHQPWVVKF